MSSIESDNEKVESEGFSNLRTLQEFFYTTLNYMGDFDDSKINKRLENLKKYSVYKMKKWVSRVQR